MIWLNLSIALLLAVASSFGASFLSSAWRRRKNAEPDAMRVEHLLPGYDCGLCGKADCPSYAFSIDAEGADPALCSPGGARLESRIRAILSERPNEPRSIPRRAIVRCGGRKGAVAPEFSYDGRPDCHTAAGFHGGPKRCKEGCIGYGSCVPACPLGAIRVIAGLAVVNPELCTGCGACVTACPTGVLTMIPREQAWYVACSSHRDPESRLRDCSAACTACAECTGRSVRGEFGLEGGLAHENPVSAGGQWQDIAEACPTRAIIQAGTEKKRPSPLPARKR